MTIMSDWRRAWVASGLRVTDTSGGSTKLLWTQVLYLGLLARANRQPDSVPYPALNVS